MIGRADRDARFAAWLNDPQRDSDRYYDRHYDRGLTRAYSGSDDGGCRAIKVDGVWQPAMTIADEARWCEDRALELEAEADRLRQRAAELR